MNAHYVGLARDKLESLKGRLAYAAGKLQEGHLQPWETKEWSQAVDKLNVEIPEAEAHLKTVLAMCENNRQLP